MLLESARKRWLLVSGMAALKFEAPARTNSILLHSYPYTHSQIPTLDAARADIFGCWLRKTMAAEENKNRVCK